MKFQCPSNVPGFATCAFSPCPVAITPGAAVAFSVTFVTSSATSAAPTVASCGGSSGVGPGVMRNPTMVLRAAPERRALPASGRFPSLWWLGLIAIFGGAALAARMKKARDDGTSGDALVAPASGRRIWVSVIAQKTAAKMAALRSGSADGGRVAKHWRRARKSTTRPCVRGGWGASRQVSLPGTIYRAPTERRRARGNARRCGCDTFSRWRGLRWRC